MTTIGDGDEDHNNVLICLLKLHMKSLKCKFYIHIKGQLGQSNLSILLRNTSFTQQEANTKLP